MHGARVEEAGDVLRPEELEDLDEQLQSFHDDSAPPLEGGVPDRVPDSHWWWYVPSRHDMPWREREEKLDGCFPALWTHDRGTRPRLRRG